MGNYNKEFPAWNPVPLTRIEPPGDAREASRAKYAAFDNFDLRRFHKRVRRFRALNLSFGNSDIVHEISRVLRNPSTGTVALATSWDEIPPSNILWRARDMSVNSIASGSFNEADLWEPPARFAGAGRFNLANDPLLYTCWGDPLGTLLEARLNASGQEFMLVGYQVTDSIFVRRLGVANYDANSNTKHRQIDRELSTFVAETLGMPVSGTDIYLYNHTHCIAGIWYARIWMGVRLGLCFSSRTKTRQHSADSRTRAS